MAKMRTVLEGLTFGEGPRWHEGRLYFSDMHSHEVVATTPEGEREVVARVEQRPSGLGWLPDGRMLVVSMLDRKLLRQEPGGELVTHADLSDVASFHLNDMVVDAQGRAYVGNFGWNLYEEPDARRPDRLALVTPEGAVRPVGEALMFANGAVITPDGRTLVVAESFGPRLTAFRVGEDGSLHDRRSWAELPEKVPDGICLDAEGAIWVASPLSGELLRVREGGEILETLRPERRPYACMLGGADRRTLFVCTATTHDPEACREERAARIEALEVEVPGAGLP